MQAAVMTDIETLQFEERERPTPDEDEVLVRIADVGICGSDLHYYTEGKIGDFVVEDPIVLGHECAGEVVETGDGVDSSAVGDRVAIEPGVPCRRCEFCKRGEYHLCADITFMATPPDDGAFVEYVAWPADFVYTLPESVSTAEGALCEPLSVGIHASRQADIESNDTVLVTGAGPIGMVAMEAAHAAGAGDVYISDVVDVKLDRAKARGAAGTIDVTERDLASAVEDLTDGRGVDKVIEASGAAPVYGAALDAVRRGGTMTCVGIGEEEIPFNFTRATNKEVKIHGSFRYSNTYPEAVDLLRRDAVDVAGIIDDEYSFDDLTTALEAAQDPGVVKTMVSM
ncbi:MULTISPECIES: NAD(P)-dependent alcohol dehydrogenase [Haloarcula]|uniref:NAD(P)-dependent alcohol dehydrogenase n=1 Tax=Haloarcula TaxID=2237 RepID=UPI0023EA844F|nr:NAD(P)-dependent alcohol dehydrogenase [Halomicroarcula sp. XH51]